MLSIEILQNGKRLCVAGHPQAESLRVTVTYSILSERPELRATAVVAQNPELMEQIAWSAAETTLVVGDTIELRLNGNVTPDAGEVIGSFQAPRARTKAELRCSFCGKNQHEVDKLIAGPAVFICSDCIDICNEVIRETDASK